MDSNKIFQVTSPVDGSIYLERPYANDADITHALTIATKAQTSWKRTSIEARQQLCKEVLKYFLQHQESIAEEITWQMGRPIQYSPFEISKGFKERASYMIDHAASSLADIQLKAENGFTRFIRKEPLGIVAVLSPWNYPFLTSVNVVIPAILAGNSVIMKSALQTPLCSERYSTAFSAAGAPHGLFQHLHLDHAQVASLLSDVQVDHVAFTGSVEGGYAIKKALGNRFINAGLELGGKDPAYVRADTNLPSTIESLVDGTYFNSGQSCCGIERIYVHQSRFEEFVEGFTALTKQYILGNPTDPATTLGPLVRTEAAEFIQYQIDEAIQQGAKPLIETGHFRQDLGPTYLSPQILINVNHDMRIMTDETFGPVVGIMPVNNDEEAVRLMNDSAYGLTGSIWTKDQEAAIQIGDRLETGTCFMNRCDYLDPALAWTGVKDSGIGCTLSTLGFDQLTRPKSFHLKR